jgi:hypothetical protein
MQVRSVLRYPVLVLTVLFGLLCPSIAAAQTPWPKVVIRTGVLLASVGSDVRIDRSNGQGTTISFVDDLGFDKHSNTFFIEGVWRISHRNRFLASYEGIRRDASHSLLTRTIVFDGQTFSAGGDVQAFFDTFYIAADYGFAVVANDTVDLGPTIGVTFLRMRTGIAASVSAESGATVSRDLAGSTAFDVPVPLPGFFLTIRPHPYVAIISAARVIKATVSDTTATFIEGKIGADFKIVHGIGVGGAYYFNKSTVDREHSSANGRMKYTFSGPQIYVAFGF